MEVWADKNLYQGLGKLIEKEQDDEARSAVICCEDLRTPYLFVAELGQELWPFTPALRRAAALGVPFQQVAFGAPGVGKI